VRECLVPFSLGETSAAERGKDRGPAGESVGEEGGEWRRGERREAGKEGGSVGVEEEFSIWEGTSAVNKIISRGEAS